MVALDFITELFYRLPTAYCLLLFPFHHPDLLLRQPVQFDVLSF
jgi:hypothetical protein